MPARSLRIIFSVTRRSLRLAASKCETTAPCGPCALAMAGRAVVLTTAVCSARASWPRPRAREGRRRSAAVSPSALLLTRGGGRPGRGRSLREHRTTSSACNAPVIVLGAEAFEQLDVSGYGCVRCTGPLAMSTVVFALAIDAHHIGALRDEVLDAVVGRRATRTGAAACCPRDRRRSRRAVSSTRYLIAGRNPVGA
jgi:hypothetical protein